MPKGQVGTIKSKFSQYLDAGAATDADWYIALNEVMPRIYHMGFWRDMMTTLEEQDVSKGLYILPEDNATTGVGYDSILHAILDDSPTDLFSIWHDYRIFGEPHTTAAADVTSLSVGVYDDGYTSFDAYTSPESNGGKGAAIDPARRRYRIAPVDSTTKATFLMKRKWVDVSSNSHYVFLPNDPSVIKHALLGKLAEDNADVQRAEYHWQTCQKLLDADLDSYRGGARPRPNIAPSGPGGTILGMY
jgi:hypothetical protein|tara:strand:+ start:626 stop:1363 length:738 start_codon:yes stop_codon:yes gene_type:complete